ncbi:60S ribosomal protein L22 [Microbotryomycetes sp. JL201]|nr:60S ribosomal protein L22 [Microbotryomycetes sp. JL201]
MAPNLVGKKKAAKVIEHHKFIVDYSQPAENKIFDEAAFEQFLTNSIKVEGKTGQLGEDVSVKREGAGKIVISSQIPMSKRYVKYLTKRFLKKNSLREWLRVVSTSPDTYTLKFFETADDADASDE